MAIRKINLVILLTLIAIAFAGAQKSRPHLVISDEDVRLMREGLGKYPLFDQTFNRVKEQIEAALKNPIDVPVPKDAGGYTHERHKKNYMEMYQAGVLYAVTKDERYARFIRDMLMKYVELYPTLGKHPMALEDSQGKLFWQTLNETVWLLHTVQAYDCVYDYLSKDERNKIETKIFRPMAKFFIVDRVSEFDRIHNHGTWTAAAVGMLGYTIGDMDLVEKALRGSKKDGSGGFLRQIDSLFSPDGYYIEGAYYVRYAIQPFILFAQAIEHNQAERKIFEYKGQFLKRALYTALQLTATDGRFLPFNDALKEMSYSSAEMVLALDIVYHHYGADSMLLGVVRKQNAVMLGGAGVTVARDLSNRTSVPDFPWTSLEIRDGSDGDAGGIGILRSGPVSDQTLVLMKYSGHGMGHGHFDKLSWMYYNAGRELVQDYGAVRFINVEPKYGGRYMPINTPWAKQTIAHNTVVVDEMSQHKGLAAVSDKYHADRHFFSAADPDFQVMSAKLDNAYPGVSMQRTMALVKDQRFPEPVLLDVARIVSKEKHQYDMPLYYLGQFVTTNVKYTAHDTLRRRLGKENGYQYLWNEAEGSANGPVLLTWLSGKRYYSVISAADPETKVLFAHIGASDPDYDLRNEPCMILRKTSDNCTFASVLEPHGFFDPVAERSDNARPSVSSVRVLAATDEGSVVEITASNSLRWILMIANGPASETQSHAITVDGKTYAWKGNCVLQK